MICLPMTVIGGYLGSGKTTLINRLLAGDHGLRLMVLVNDFGAVNIDARLLKAATEDRIELTNGCVCCTMGADLFMAIGDVLDRTERPDHLLIEASGISDPARIAQAALTEPALAYGGTVTLIDGLTWDALSTDVRIGPQIRAQRDLADLCLTTKTKALPGTIGLDSLDDPAPLLLGLRPFTAPVRATAPHPAYRSWSTTDAAPLDTQPLLDKLAARPPGLFRLKGWLPAPNGASWEVHCVGPTVDIRPAPKTEPQLIGIGLASEFEAKDADHWWQPA